MSGLSLSKRELAVEDNGFRLRESVPGMYALFKLEPLYNLHLGISKILMSVNIYIYNLEVFTRGRKMQQVNKSPFLHQREAVLHTFNMLCGAGRKDSGKAVIQVDSSKRATSHDINVLFTNTGLQRILKKKSHR